MRPLYDAEAIHVPDGDLPIGIPEKDVPDPIADVVAGSYSVPAGPRVLRDNHRLLDAVAVHLPDADLPVVVLEHDVTHPVAQKVADANRLHLQVQGAGVIQRLKSGVKLLARGLRRGLDGGCLLDCWTVSETGDQMPG